MAEREPKAPFPLKPAEGWWEYGVGGVVMGMTGKPVEPDWCHSKLDAEIKAERHERLYVVKRFVTPGVWQRLEPSDSDDHPTVDDWTWEQYLEWRRQRAAKTHVPLTDITTLGD